MYEELDNHALLLLYAVGELPEANREKLERELAQNASLRDELETLRVSEQSIQRALAALDASEPIPGSQFAAATRQTARALRQWQVDRVMRPTAQRGKMRRLRLDWRAYSVAAAAAVMIFGFSVWWQNSDHAPDSPPQEQQVAANENELIEQVATAFDQTGRPPVAREEKIDQAEHDLDELRDLTQISRPNDFPSEPDSEMQ